MPGAEIAVRENCNGFRCVPRHELCIRNNVATNTIKNSWAAKVELQYIESLNVHFSREISVELRCNSEAKPTSAGERFRFQLTSFIFSLRSATALLHLLTQSSNNGH